MLAPKLKRHKPPLTLLAFCCCLLYLLNNLAIISECQDQDQRQQLQLEAGSDVDDNDRSQKHSSNLVLPALSTAPVEQDRRQANLFRANNNENNNPNDLIRNPADQNDLSAGVGGDLATAETMMSVTSDTSHEIIASGWPVTSSMWPSLKTELSQQDNKDTGTSGGGSSSSSQTWQPFIYADKPSKQDYSLLLSLNKTLIELLKINFNKQPTSSGQPAQMSVDLSFDYYFNQLSNATAPPGIKIELDRKEFDYLEPASGSGGAAADSSSLTGGNGDQLANSGKSGRLIKSKMWIGYNKRIMLTDLVQLDKLDWLKLSLVNREAPSLVAIRRLRVAFGGSGDGPAPTQAEGTPADQGQQAPQPEAPPQRNGAPPANNGPPPASQQQSTTTSGPPIDQETSTGPASSSSTVEPPVLQTTQPERAAPADERWRQSSPPAPAQSPPAQLETESTPDEPPLRRPPPPRRNPNSDGALDETAAGYYEPQPEASEALGSTIKPVDAKKKKGWAASIGLGRKKRQAGGGSIDGNGQDQLVVTGSSSTTNSSAVIELTCYQSDACEHWKTEQAAGQIQWSLARMPPSTDAVRNGYYYVSNRRNYGAHSGPLLLRINQTETATITDQKTDHCIELALYVTERTRLRLFKMVKRTNGTESSELENAGFDEKRAAGEWLKTSLLLTWAPTTTTVTTTTASSPSPSSSSPLPVTKHVERAHLNGAQMAASNHSGWTLETLCFGHFFEEDRKCGLAECAFAFEMDTLQVGGSDESASARYRSEETELVAGEARQGDDEDYSIVGQQEQVVGVALLRKYAIGAPNKQMSPARWLEFWQRPDLAPSDNWKFYPQMDFSEQQDNISLLNLYDEAQYSIHSDWIQMSDHLNLNASFLIEVVQNSAEPPLSESGQPSNNGTQTVASAGASSNSFNSDTQHNQGEEENNSNELVFRLHIKQRLVNQHFETVHSTNTTIDWFKHYSYKHQLDLYDLSMANVSSLMRPAAPSDQQQNQNDELTQQHQQQPKEAPSLFKVIIELVLDCHWLTSTSQINSNDNGKDQTMAQQGAPGTLSQQERMPRFRFLLTNVSLADRCFPNPCQWGDCKQNGTGLEDWNCGCDKEHRGRRCQFGSWCGLQHVVPTSLLSSNQLQSSSGSATGLAGQPAGVPLALGGGLQKRQFETTSTNANNNSQLIVLKLNQPHQSNDNGSKSPIAGGAQLSANNNKIGQPDSGGVPINAPRLTGEEFCRRKLGAGFRCQEIDLPLDDRIYRDEGETFSCFCRDDYYLSDEGKCKQAHRCNSIVCPAVGQICDESRPFNETQPCHCNEKQDWYQESPSEPNRCVRRQCHDKKRDCGFDAHVCLATSAGERPVCKCGPKFTLKTTSQEKTNGAGGSGQKYCQSTACVLPTLNDCEQICTPNDQDLQRPYNCSCYPGFALDQDGKSCKPALEPRAQAGNGQSSQSSQQQHKHRSSRQGSSGTHAGTAGPVCKPACDSKTQICTELGCRCRQGYVPEGEVIVQVNAPPSMVARNSSASGAQVDYVQSVRCLNVCSLSYAENKLQFERIESVCPLGLCDPASFNCRCSDPNSSALVQSKYEPIWANETVSAGVVSNDEDTLTSSSSDPDKRQRASPLCHLKRVCQPESAGYQLCKARGAICVPDYTKPAMFDCVCPPTSEKRPVTAGSAGSGSLLGQQLADFNCEPRCGAIKQECIKKQAVCRMMNKDQARCECLPGMMLDKHDDKCYLAHYTYSMNLIIVNKYYEPKTRPRDQLAHRGPNGKVNGGETNNNNTDTTDSDDGRQDAPLHEILPQFQRSSSLPLPQASYGAALATGGSSSFFPLAYMSQQQCNTSQLLPKSVIEDPYEHEMGAFLQYIEQCNERLHEDSRAFSLNARLGDDLRQSLRQHLRESFTITTNNSLCLELPTDSSLSSSDGRDGRGTTTASTGAPSSTSWSLLPVSFLNCTVFLQSMEPIEAATINRVFTNCDKTGVDERFCWIKPRLLLMKSQLTAPSTSSPGAGANQEQDPNPFNFKQIVPCELSGFCGPDARSERLDNSSSLCSCKCPPDIEMIDLREMEPRLRQLIPQAISSPSDTPTLPLLLTTTMGVNRGAIKEICAPRNHCGPNSTYCSLKTGSICEYDIRVGSRCYCVYPAYEDELGHCVEIAFSQLDNTLIVIIIMVGTCLIVSLAINLYALAKTKRGLMFGQSRQYPLSEFSSSCATPGTRNLVNNHGQYPTGDGSPPPGRHQRAGRPFNRSTGVPNLAFDPDD